MRLLCVNNVGCNLALMETYEGELVSCCSKCDAVGYYISGESRKMDKPFVRCVYCRHLELNNGGFQLFKKERFVIIDDLHEIEEQEYSEQLENV